MINPNCMIFLGVDSMLRFNLRGGLGNQLFIIATAVEFSIKLSTPIVFIERQLQVDKKRSSRLIDLGLIPNILYMPSLSKNSIDFEKILSEPVNATQIIDYWGQKYTDLFIDVNKKSVELNGYFQSAKFFTHTFDNFLNYLRNKLQLIDSSQNRTVFQIRLGDLARDRDIRRIHGYCHDSYWIKSLNMLSPEASVPIVITDDASGIKKFLPNFNFHMERNNFEISAASDIEDLALMANSKERVISNSTFGWWGSHLAGGGITIAPRNWFNEYRLLTASEDLQNPEWLYI